MSTLCRNENENKESEKNEIQANSETNDNFSNEVDSKDDTKTGTSFPSENAWSVKTECKTQLSQTIKTIDDNGIVLVPNMQAFMVKGSKQTKYSVTLFPKEDVKLVLSLLL